MTIIEYIIGIICLVLLFVFDWKLVKSVHHSEAHTDIYNKQKTKEKS